MKHALAAFNPKIAGGYEFADFFDCCVFRMASSVGYDLEPGSIVVIYRTEEKRIIGEFEVVRVEYIDKPKKNSGEEAIYEKIMAYPVSLFDGEHYGPTHIFFRNLQLYSPEILYDVFLEHWSKKYGTRPKAPRTIMYLDDNDLDFIRDKTAREAAASIIK